MIFVDYSPIAISNNLVNLGGRGEGTVYPNPEELRIMIWRALGAIRNNYSSKYGQMCIAFDSKPYYRETIFPHYKKNRKKLTGDIHWGTIAEIEATLHHSTPWKTISIPTVEADDIIGTMAPILAQTEPCIIVSPDSDFGQLQIHKNITQVDIIRLERDMVCKDAAFTLQEKIIRGDSKDGIPNILSDEDTFMVDGKRQKPMTAKRLREFMSVDVRFWDNKEAVKRYKMNQSLIDLSKIPDDIKRNITYHFSMGTTTTERGSLRKYFIENRMAEQADNIRNYL